MKITSRAAGLLSFAISAAFLATAARGAPTYDYTIQAPGPFQVLNSPTPVSKTATATSGPFSSATSAAAGPGYLSGSSHATLDLPNGANGSASGFSQESSDFNLDNIVISGPGGTVSYTVNVSVAGAIAASIFGAGPFTSGSGAELRFGTGSSLGGFGGLDIGHIDAQNGVITDATGVFAGIGFNVPGSGTSATPVWSARAGDTINVGLILDTVASTTESFGSGPGAMDAFASFNAQFLGAHLFNFLDPTTGLPVTGWSASSLDGCIVDNVYSCAPAAAVPEPEIYAMLLARLGLLPRARKPRSARPASIMA